MTYWIIRVTFRWLFSTRLFNQQCGGKIREGGGTVWCQKRALHEGVCVDFKGQEFQRPYDGPVF
jgi:hypothetical protein